MASWLLKPVLPPPVNGCRFQHGLDASRERPLILPEGERPLATTGILPASRTAGLLFLERKMEKRSLRVVLHAKWCKEQTDH